MAAPLVAEVEAPHPDEDDQETGEQDQGRHPDQEDAHHPPENAHSGDVRLFTHDVQKVMVLTHL